MPLRALLVALLVAPLALVSAPAQAGVFGHGARAAKAMTSTAKVQRAHRAHRVSKMLHIAQRQTGDPYQYGAAGPNAFDCSGLVYYATHHAGLRAVPRTSSAQSQFMRRIPRSKMHRGDFVFFTGSGGVYHVAIYLGMKAGHRTILHAPHTGARVRREAIWTDAWFPGTLRRR